MSKDIWHTKKEKPMLQRDIILCGDGWSMAMDIIPETVNNICWKNVEKWCYLDDLIKENERTRKALDVAVEKAKALKELADIAGFRMFSAGCQDIIKQITAPEQKDVK
jgi:hypothetical protein